MSWFEQRFWSSLIQLVKYAPGYVKNMFSLWESYKGWLFQNTFGLQMFFLTNKINWEFCFEELFLCISRRGFMVLFQLEYESFISIGI